jgi:hypothetical protein
MLGNVFEVALRDSVLFLQYRRSSQQCMYIARTFSHLYYKNLCCMLGYWRLSFGVFENIKFGEVRLGHWKYCRYDLFRFRFYFSLFVCLTRMRGIQDTATIALDEYDIMYAGGKSDADVGTGRRRQFLNRYGFRFFRTL